ncbi:uncharacterized protein LOC132624099 [Lycium barbarum]|uniref:uncharacterized protein LOC132624099 n=1 Tax=Lycium barbarum TaxID=112863 RepID=UPI00293ECAFD|nr:uncharacterized protein LOC132624099 [Lycium barbarum]
MKTKEKHGVSVAGCDFAVRIRRSSELRREGLAAVSTALWQRLDDIVRQWIYGTISNDLLNSIINPDDTAMDAWKRLEDCFHNNKSARALHLDAQFTNTRLEQFTGVKQYCTHLKTLADSLRNVGDKVSDNPMALQLLKGLSEEYKPFRTSVRHMSPLPSFDTLRSMLELEEQGNEDTDTTSATDTNESALFSSSNDATGSQYGSAGNGTTNHSNSGSRGRKSNKGRGGKNRGGSTGGRNNNQLGQQQPKPNNKQQQPPRGNQQQQFPWMFPSPWAFYPQQPWATPPCPYPSQQQGPYFYSPRPLARDNQQGILGPRPTQAYYSDGSQSTTGYAPTDINQAMHTLSMIDPNYYMDTGATSHMSNSRGFTDGEQNNKV